MLIFRVAETVRISILCYQYVEGMPAGSMSISNTIPPAGIVRNPTEKYSGYVVHTLVCVLTQVP